MAMLTLPAELLTEILSYLQPRDVLHTGRTCQQIWTILRPSNNFLWHAVFLQVFDDPQHAWAVNQARSRQPSQLQADPAFHLELSSPTTRTTSSSEITARKDGYWHDLLRKRLMALRSLAPTARDSIASDELGSEDVINIVLDILDTAKTGPTPKEKARGIVPQVDDRSSLNLQVLSPVRDPWIQLEGLIHDCHVKDHVNSPQDETRPITRSRTLKQTKGPRSQNACRLHVLYGRTHRERIERGVKGAARQIVYDWQIPNADNDYGPFEADGTGHVNWKCLEAVATLMLWHFEQVAEGRIAIPPGFCYSLPCRTLIDPTTPEDWAHLTGSWIGTYSFIGYPDLFHYNSQPEAINMDEVEEARGDLMVTTLKLDMSVKDQLRHGVNLPISSKLPTLYFSGSSKAYDAHVSQHVQVTVRGSVSLCANDKEVRWRYLISYRGEESWQLEGVQPGGVRSGPVYGLWTQWDHHQFSPVGSFMYMPEELCKRQELVFVS